MKNTLILIVLLSLCFKVYSQNYIPLVDTNSVWYITHNCYPNPPYPCYSDYYKYRISGDTMINDTMYKQLFRIDMNMECPSVIEDSVFVGAVRENISEKKVYFIQDTWWGEYLLYDFGLETGDTVPNTFNNYGYPELHVSTIDSILCTDGYRKRFIYSRDTWADIEVIEGIGSFTGLIEAMEIFEHNSMLRCFYNSGAMVYKHDYVNSCNLEMDTCLATNIEESSQLSESVTLYPNPVYDKALIQINNPRREISRYWLKIIDVTGKILLDKTFSTNKILLDKNDFIPGIYFYIVHFNSQKVSSGNFIVK